MPFALDFNSLDKGVIIFIIVTYCISAVGKYFMFHKIKENGYNGVLPVYSDYILFDKCWESNYFFVYIALFAAVLGMPYLTDVPESLIGLAFTFYSILACLYSIQLARAFGKGYPHLILVCIIPAIAMLLKLNNLYVLLGLFINPFLMLALGLDKNALPDKKK